MRRPVLVLLTLVLLTGCVSARLDAWRTRADTHQVAVQAYDRDADRFLADYRAVSDHPSFARTTEKFRALYARLSVETGAEPRGRLIDATVSSMDADEVKISTRLLELSRRYEQLKAELARLEQEQTSLTLDMQRIEQDQARGAAVANALAAWQRQRGPRRLNCMTNYAARDQSAHAGRPRAARRAELDLRGQG